MISDASTNMDFPLTDMIKTSTIFVILVYISLQVYTIVVPTAARFVCSSFKSAIASICSSFKDIIAFICSSLKSIIASVCSSFKGIITFIFSIFKRIVASILIYEVANQERVERVIIILIVVNILTDSFNIYGGTKILLLTLVYAAKVLFEHVFLIHYEHVKFLISDRMLTLKLVAGFGGVVDPDEVEVALYLLS